MNDQVFELENFRGPLDLLLHLVREQELEIIDVDCSRLCDQYLSALELMAAVDIDVAGDFLVMASTLLLIKSRTILPREEEVDLQEELDPADELIQQLLEYRKYKTLSLELGRRATERNQRLGRGETEVPPDEENELADLGVWDLVGSFVRLMEEIGLERNFHTLDQEKPLRAYLRETLDRLSERPLWTLRDLVLSAGGPDQVFGVFLALLELVKTGQVAVSQQGAETDIEVALREDREPGLLDELSDGPASAGEDRSTPAATPVDTTAGLAASDGDSIVSPLAPPAPEG